MTPEERALWARVIATVTPIVREPVLPAEAQPPVPVVSEPMPLEAAIARGDRVLLLITGKPPRPESERPHARGAIRAAVGDWLAASRHGDRIAAVRGAHPRHGGQGALYIVLKRQRPAPRQNF